MANPIEVSRLLGEGRMSPTQRAALGICTAIATIEGFDAQIMGYVAPAITRDWGVSPARFTIVFTAGVVGMIIGALLVGPIADRRGRKSVLLMGISTVGVFTALGAFAPSITAMAGIRVLAGIGVGATTPTIVALVSEYAPAHRRATFTMVVISGMSVGGFVGGLGVAWILPALGWQAVMLIGGAIPLLIVLLCARGLPESLAFLVATGRDSQARNLLVRIDPSLDSTRPMMLQESSHHSGRAPMRELFNSSLRYSTLLLWLSFLSMMTVTYFVTSWIPTLFVTAGMSAQDASFAMAVTMLGSLFGGITMGVLVDRTRLRFGILSLGLIVAAAAIGMLVMTAGSTGPMLISLFLVGFGALGCQIGIFAAAADAYPTAVRSTGVSWASGVGRFGSLLGPALGGILVASMVGPYTIFGLLTVPILLGAIAIGSLARATSHRSRHISVIGDSTREATAVAMGDSH